MTPARVESMFGIGRRVLTEGEVLRVVTNGKRKMGILEIKNTRDGFNASLLELVNNRTRGFNVSKDKDVELRGVSKESLVSIGVRVCRDAIVVNSGYLDRMKIVAVREESKI